MNNSNLTPDRNDVTGIKISKFERVQKTVTQTRVLQTDRKNNQKIKSPLMIILLLRKKLRHRIQHAFIRLNMYKNKANNHKIIAKYISSILKFKIKLNQAHVIQKLKSNRKGYKNLLTLTTAFTSWINNKFRNRKSIAFISLKHFSRLAQLSNKEDNSKGQLPNRNPLRDSKVVTSTKKQQPNRSLDLGNKSVSASRLNLAKKLDFDKQQDVPVDIIKMRKQNQELKLMELSQEARQALKKVQRFDRFIYAQETEKVCKEVLSNELRRLQKIKNSQKQMRAQFYDNQLTITALFNHIKLISELNRDLGDLNKFKQIYEKQQAKRKQQQFKANLESKRAKNKTINVQAQIKQLVENIQSNLLKNDYQKAKQDIQTIVIKFQKEQLLKDKIILYKYLLQSLSTTKQIEKSIQDILKISQSFKTIDVTQAESTVKSMKAIQKQLNQLVAKYTKQQQSQKTLNILKSFQITNTSLIQLIQVQKSPTKQILSQKNNLNDEPNKRIDPIQFEQLKRQIELINKSKTQFQSKVNQIIQKAKNKVDIKKDLDNLRKDKLFQQKPYSLFFFIQQIYANNAEDQINSQLTIITNFITSLTQTYIKEKVKSDMKTKETTTIIENLLKKNPKLSDLTKNIENLLLSVSKNTQNMLQQQSSIRVKTQQIQSQTKQNNRSRTSSQQPRQITKAIDVTEKRFIQIFEKIKRNQDWIIQFQNIKKDKSVSSNKSYQLLLNFYDNVSELIKKNKANPNKLQKLISSIMKVLQNKKVAEDKKLQQIQKAFEQASKVDPYLEQTFKLIFQWSKNILSMIAENQKQIQKERSKSKQLSQKNKSLQNRKDQSKQKQVKRPPIQPNKTDSITKQQIKQLQDELKAFKQRDAKQKIEKSKEVTTINQVHKSITTITSILQSRNIKQLQIQSIKLIKSYQKDQKFANIALLISQLIKIIIQKQTQQPGRKKQGQNTPINKVLQLLRSIGDQANKKQFFKGDQGWNAIEQSMQKQDKIGKALIKLIKKICDISRIRLSQQRKANQKSMKSYQNQLQKLNKIINQNQIKMKEKDDNYQQLSKALVDMQKQTGENRKRSSSLKSSRKSARSSDKEEQLRNIKASIHALAGEQKNMLEKLNMVQNEKIALVERLNAVQNDLKVSFKTIQQQRITIRNLQKNITQQHSNYQKQFEDWKTKSINHARQMDEIRNRYKRQLVKKQEKLGQQYDNILKQRQEALQQYHKDFTNIQNQLNNQIQHLKQQLRINSQQNKIEDYEILRKNYLVLQQSYSILKHKSGIPDSLSTEKQQASSYTQKIIQENQNLQLQIKQQKSRAKDLQRQIFNLNLLLQRSKAGQGILQQKLSTLQFQLKNNRSSVQQLQNSPRIKQLEQQSSALKQMIDSLEAQLKRAKQIFTNEHVEKLQGQIKYLQHQNQILEINLTRVKSQMENLKVPLENIKIQLYNARIQQDDRERQIQVKLKLVQNLQLQLKNAKQSQKLLQEQLKAYQNRIKTLENDLASTKNTNQILKQQAKVQKSSRAAQVQQLQKQIINFRQENANIEFQINNYKLNLQKIPELEGNNIILSQNIVNLQNQLRTLKGTIQNLESELRKSQNSLQNQSKQYNRLKIINQGLQKQIVTYKTQSSQMVQPTQPDRVQQLQEQLNKIKAQQGHIIDQQIKIALKHQQQDFNRFLGNHQKDIQNHFFNIVIPERIRQALEEYKANNIQQANSVQKQPNDQIYKLKQINNKLQGQLDQQVQALKETNTKYQNQIKITQDLQVNLTQIKRINIQLERNKTQLNQERQLTNQINKLKSQITKLQIQYDNQLKIATQNDNRYRSQLKTTQDQQRKFNQDIRGLRSNINDLENKMRNNSLVQQRVKKYLQALQITWQEATLGYVNERVTKLYLKSPKASQAPQTIIKQVIKQVTKQVIKPDPKQQFVITDLGTKLDNQVKLFRELEAKYFELEQKGRTLAENRSATDLKILHEDLNRSRQTIQDVSRRHNQQIQVSRQLRKEINIIKGSQQALKLQLQRVQMFWEERLREQTTSFERKIRQIQSKKSTITSTSVQPVEQIKILQLKLQDLDRRYNEQARIKLQIQHRYNQAITSYQTRIHDIGHQAMLERNQFKSQISMLQNKNNHLQNMLNDRDKLFKGTEDKLRRQLSDQIRRYQQRIASYEKRITQTSTSSLTTKTYQIGSLNHGECERKYRDLQLKSNKQIGELKIRISQIQTGSNEIQLLRQVISNQKIQLKQLQVMLNSLKQSKEQANKQKEMYFNQMKLLSGNKDQQIMRLRAQYDNRIKTLTIQKNTLQNNIKQYTNQSIQDLTFKSTDKSNLKIIELQSLINSKNQQIRHLEDIIQRRKRQIQEEHEKLVTCQRQRQNIRMNCNSMQSHIMRLQADISYLNNQLQRHRIMMQQMQSRQVALRNDLFRVKSQGSQPQTSNKNLKQQINTLKDEIIRITTTNIQQIHSITHENTYDSGKIKKMIHDIQIQRNTERYGYEEAQLEILHKINQQVTQLVAANRQLQTKCVLLESQIEGGGKFMQDIDVFLMLQQKIQSLVNFLIQKNLLDNTDNYSKFMHNSKQCLSLHDVQGYFNNWLNFMKSLFLLTNDLKSQQLRQKAEEMIELKQQMNQILDKHIEFAEDQNYQTLEKYKMIFSDIRILLKEYINTRNEQYIQMIWRSLDTGENDQGQII